MAVWIPRLLFMLYSMNREKSSIVLSPRETALTAAPERALVVFLAVLAFVCVAFGVVLEVRELNRVTSDESPTPRGLRRKLMCPVKCQRQGLGGRAGSVDGLGSRAMVSEDALTGEGHGLSAVANVELGVQVA